jgi:heparanase 1
MTRPARHGAGPGIAAATLATGAAIAGLTVAAGGQQTPLAVKTLPRIATIDERYQSYNIEMAELTGGQFWKPYEDFASQPAPDTATGTSGQEKGDFYARLKAPMEPTDLSNARLRALAAALGPAYVRSSGNAADAVYFHDSDGAAPQAAPKGFESVLTRQQWTGLVDFAHAVNAEIVTSFAVSTGTRDANGRWTPDQARRLIDYTHSIGGRIAAAEFFNEPTLGPQGIGGLPPGYDAGAFARDFAIFRPFAKSAEPDMLIAGPSATGEGPVKLLSGDLIHSNDLLAATPRPLFDAFSYHAYSASSLRCKSPGKVTTTADAALTEDWLSRTEKTYEFYASLRDRYQPGRPIWVTETAESSCGGDPWAKTFLDSFRYLDQLGRLARHGVQTVMHNTLAVSEYSLIDRDTLEPRPNYWAALLWRRLMGTTVLDAGGGPPSGEGLHLYVHCLPGQSGGVTLLAINTSRTQPASIDLPMAAERYTLTAQRVEDEQVQLNGSQPRVQATGEPPALQGQSVEAGRIDILPATISFLAFRGAGISSCRQ